MNIKLEIPESFYQGEERCGYYVSPEMKKIWAVELDLLNEFARVCEKYNLKWCIAYGTLLGAVRHKGFIPWDDDVDVMMPISDCKKLQEIAPAEFEYPYYLSTPSNSAEHICTRPKLFNSDTTLCELPTYMRIKSGRKTTINEGIFLDVFPIYDIPDNEREFMKICRKAFLFRFFMVKFYKASEGYYPHPQLWKRLILTPLHYSLGLFNLKPLYLKFHKKHMDTICSYSNPDSKRVIDFGVVHEKNFYERYIWERKCFSDVKYLPFEFLSLPAPAHYEEILSRVYGDWHEHKITHIHGVFVDTERSYKYYTEEGHPFEVK